MFIHLLGVCVMPLLLAALIRRTKARMQGRPGPPFAQPLFDLVKRFNKGETVSLTTSWVFRANPYVGFAVALVIAIVVPWTGSVPLLRGTGSADLILIAYLLAFARFFAVLAALDTGSAFGGLGASRESALAVLVEPSILVSLAAIAVSGGSTDLSIALEASIPATVALLGGFAFLLAALAELSRMPVDDPTTHLELTMIHEATILENSGRNLAIVETTVYLRTAVFFGIGIRMLMSCTHPMMETGALQIALTLGSILLFGILLGVMEGISVKLNWRRIPAFVAFSTILAVMSAFISVVGVKG
jgi:formate hydrogenlyase subunit 4